MGDGYPNNSPRPKASVGTIVNALILAVMLLGGGVSAMIYLGTIRQDISVLQVQVNDLRVGVAHLADRLDDYHGGNGK